MPRFHNESPNTERCIWAPQAHYYYQERCYIYLVSGRDPERRSTFTEELDKLLDEVDIESRLVHVLFGQYDSLVRIWATEPARARFLRVLRKSRLEVDGFVEFAADDIRYTFSSAEALKLPEEVVLTRQQQEHVKSVVAAERADAWDVEAEEALGSLKDDGLIYDVPRVGGVKVYMFFSAIGNNLAQPRDFAMSKLIETAQNVGIEQLSCYSGVGFCHFVLKGWISDYSDVLPKVNTIRQVAKDLRLSPWTLPIADSSKGGGETIDAVLSQLPQVLEGMLRDAEAFLDDQRLHEFRRELASLPHIDRDGVVKVYRDANEQLEADEVQRVLEIIAASTLLDRKTFNRSMSYLTSIEEDLRSLVPAILAEADGPDWLNNARARGWLSDLVIDSSGSSGDGSRLQLAEFLLLLSRAEGEWLAVRDKIRDLPNDWGSHIRGIISLRNQFAHGSLWDLAKGRSFGSQWGETFADIFTSISLQSFLENPNRPS